MSQQQRRLTEALADRYTIERELGAGGMATVYLAEDVKHHRKVAVKVLRPELAAALGPDRFLREIEIAAHLQHPHILMLIDSGEADGVLYYVMPYVEGQSLRDKLDAEGEFPIPVAMRILRDVVDALAHAHEHGVVHRDIKPDNVMLSGRHALVTDFGVAKAVSEATGQQALTTAGVALGTPAYMAPEQAVAASNIDHRADIYAVGALAYELLTGRPPFTGANQQAVLAAQVTEVPDPVTKYREAVPPELEQLVARCLEKKAADRWQSAEELLPQLEALATPSGGITPAGTRPVAVRSDRKAPYLWGGAIAVAVITVGVLAMQVLQRRLLDITVSNIRQVTTDVGLEFQPAVSPDGEEVAYVVGPIGKPRIVVKSTIDIGGDGVRLAKSLGGLHWFPSWSGDGASVRFGVGRPLGQLEWRAVGKLGGAPRTYPLEQGARGEVWSPVNPHGWVGVVGDSILLADSAGGEPSLVTATGQDLPGGGWLHSFARSPDGQLMAYVYGFPGWRTSGNVAQSSIWIVKARGGTPVQVTGTDANMNESPQWLAGSRHLLFVSNRDGPRGIYAVEVGPDGPLEEPRPVMGSSDPHSISVSADGSTLAYAKFTFRQNIWSLAIPEEGVASIAEAVPVTRGNHVIESHDLSPGGDSIVFDGTLRGNSDLYRQSLSGGAPTLIADLPGHIFRPRWSAEGSDIVFYVAQPGGTADIAVVPAAGGVPQQITEWPVPAAQPAWAPDGLSIAFSSAGPEGKATDWWTIWTVSRDQVGGAWRAPAQLTEFPCFLPTWHPDGMRLACLSIGRGELDVPDLILTSREGQELGRFSSGMQSGVWESYDFSADGSRIYQAGTAEDGVQGVWWVPTEGGARTQVVAFDDPSRTVVIDMTVGPEHLYFTIAEYESDVYVADLEY